MRSFWAYILIRQRHLVSTIVHIIVFIYMFITRFTTSQYHQMIDNKLCVHYNFVVPFILVGTIGLLDRYSLARTSVSCVVSSIIGVTASLVRR